MRELLNHSFDNGRLHLTLSDGALDLTLQSENALEALCTADTVAAQKIVQGDDRINNMEQSLSTKDKELESYLIKENKK